MSIKKGSIVNIFWENIQCERNLEVVSVPVNEVDDWIFKNKFSMEIRVRNFCKMEEVYTGEKI